MCELISILSFNDIFFDFIEQVGGERGEELDRLINSNIFQLICYLFIKILRILQFLSPPLKCSNLVLQKLLSPHVIITSNLEVQLLKEWFMNDFLEASRKVKILYDYFQHSKVSWSTFKNTLWATLRLHKIREYSRSSNIY